MLTPPLANAFHASIGSTRDCRSVGGIGNICGCRKPTACTRPDGCKTSCSGRWETNWSLRGNECLATKHVFRIDALNDFVDNNCWGERKNPVRERHKWCDRWGGSKGQHFWCQVTKPGSSCRNFNIWAMLALRGIAVLNCGLRCVWLVLALYPNVATLTSHINKTVKKKVEN